MYIYIHTYKYVYIYIYTYIHTDRQRDNVCMCLCERERESGTESIRVLQGLLDSPGQSRLVQNRGLGPKKGRVQRKGSAQPLSGTSRHLANMTHTSVSEKKMVYTNRIHLLD